MALGNWRDLSNYDLIRLLILSSSLNRFETFEHKVISVCVPIVLGDEFGWVLGGPAKHSWHGNGQREVLSPEQKLLRDHWFDEMHRAGIRQEAGDHVEQPFTSGTLLRKVERVAAHLRNRNMCGLGV